MKTEKEYRQKHLDSSSSLKDFSVDRKKYYKKYILNDTDKEEEDTNLATLTGKVVETILLEPDLYDEKFYISACATPPGGMMLDFIEALYKEAKDATNDDGTITASFESMSRLAYEKSGYKITYDAVVKKFAEGDNQIYFEEICRVREKNLTVVTGNIVENAQKIADALQENRVTGKIFNQQTNSRYTVINQAKIHGYVIDDLELKSMLDKIIIDHQEHTITPFDLKCTWTVENFYTEYYLYRRSYIQAYLYKRACEWYRDQHPELASYEVKNTAFIVCDSINYYNPLIYTLSFDDMRDAYLGFDFRNKKYPGARDIIIDLKWALENDVWNMSKDAYESAGILNIKYGY